MTKKQIIILVALGVFVVLVLVFGFLTNHKNVLPGILNLGNNTQNILNLNATGTAGIYSPQVPQNAVLTKPKSEAPASANPNLTTKIKFFDMKATSAGFSPNSITVNKGDSLRVNFTAQDGDYDLSIPYLGASFSVIKKGTARELPIDTSTPGTFVFECSSYCPSGGKIQGTLIVLP